MVLNSGGQVQIRYQEEITYLEGGEALEQFSQRGCEYPIPGNVQGQVGWGFEQLDLVRGICVHSKESWKQIIFKVTSNPNYSMILGFYEF